MLLGVGFYEEVLVELMAAVGAALFFGNLLALSRRNRVPDGVDDDEEVIAAPVIRTVAFMGLGFAVMVWGLLSIFT